MGFATQYVASTKAHTCASTHMHARTHTQKYREHFSLQSSSSPVTKCIHIYKQFSFGLWKETKVQSRDSKLGVKPGIFLQQQGCDEWCTLVLLG